MFRYLQGLAALSRGDWGFSSQSRTDVARLILDRVPTTLFVVGSSQILALLVAVPVGIAAAVRPYSLQTEVQAMKVEPDDLDVTVPTASRSRASPSRPTHRSAR